MFASVHPGLLTVAEAAARSVNEKTVRLLIGRGELPAVQLGGKGAAVRISEQWLYWNGDAA